MDSPNNAFLLEALTALLSGPLTPGVSGPKVHLAKAAFAPGPNLTPASFTESDFTGYAAIVVLGWGTPHITPGDGAIVLANAIMTFTNSGGGTAQSAYGWWIEDHANNVVSCGIFNPPVPMGTTGDLLSFVAGVGCGGWSLNTTLLP